MTTPPHLRHAGPLLRAVRVSRGVSIRHCARRMGVSSPTLHQLETRASQPWTVGRVEGYLQGLGITDPHLLILACEAPERFASQLLPGEPENVGQQAGQTPLTANQPTQHHENIPIC